MSPTAAAFGAFALPPCNLLMRAVIARRRYRRSRDYSNRRHVTSVVLPWRYGSASDQKKNRNQQGNLRMGTIEPPSIDTEMTAFFTMNVSGGDIDELKPKPGHAASGWGHFS
jgi:hypothetical protein